MNKIVCVVVVSLLTNAGVFADSEKTLPDWRIEVVPSRNSVGKGAVIYAKKSLDVFYVVLHNQSGKDLKVWRDWCPWGYNNLSLTAEQEGGRKVSITRVPNDWDQSYPDAALVKAGQCYVYEIRLAGKTWKGIEKISEKPFKLSVTFKVQETAEAKQKKVWIGEVTSNPVPVTLRK